MNPTDKITEHFMYSEVIESNIANSMRMDNNPSPELLIKIKLVAENILEKVRAHFNAPIKITSWYRCPALNQILSNNPNSQHIKGEAVDFIVSGISNMEISKYIRDHLDFDQLILEKTWIHCSYIEKGNRKNILRTYDGMNYLPGLETEK